MTRFLQRLAAPAARATSGALAAGCLAAGLATGGATALAPSPAQAQATPSLMEFRWDNTKDYRKLYYFMSETGRLKWSEYYLLLRPKDRQTAILKLTIALPKYFNVKIDPKQVKLCYMKEGGMLARTRCESVIPATVEIAADGTAIEIFPDTPVPDLKTIGVYMNLMNPFDAGMYQFNALAQAPGAVPISGYLGSWLIQIDPAVGN